MNPRLDDDQPTGAKWAELARLAAVCGRNMRRSIADQAARHELSDAEFLLLWACRESAENDATQNGLAASIGLSSSQLSGLVERLRQRGLATVERSRLDRRRQHWCLTPAGVSVVNDVLNSLGTFEQSLEATLSPDEQARTVRLFDALSMAATRDTAACSAPAGHRRAA